jgi:predicted phosphodiesterase
MRVALLSDVHGNTHALDAVLADTGALGVDAYWALGDLVAIGPDPVGVLERLAALPGVRFVRGNTERYVMGDTDPSFRSREDPEVAAKMLAVQVGFGWTAGVLHQAGWLDWVASIPVDYRTTLPDGTSVLATHAAPGNDRAWPVPDPSDDEAAALLAGADADIVFAGHSHVALDRMVGEVRYVNLGSVSNPLREDLKASYVVVDANDSKVTVEHRFVDYDHDAFIKAVEASRHPSAEHITALQRGESLR